MSRKLCITTSIVLSALLAIACNPSRPMAGDGGITDAPADTTTDPPPDGTVAPSAPGTAMETVVGAGHATSSTMVIDIQLGGGLPGAASTPTHQLRSAPSLP